MTEQAGDNIVKRLREFMLLEAASEIEKYKAEIERLREALQQIQKWSEAYPIDIFHEPSKEECKRAHKLLTANGMTLDAFSAAMGRHCTKGVGDIARRALEGK